MSVLAIDKPSGPTSHDVVDAVRRALRQRRVGHFGTLDPFASGLLVLGAGPATRLAPFCVDHGKTYRATVRLGARSDTDDPEGAVETVPDAVPPDLSAVEAACEAWVGEVAQVPPAYSAKHVQGERAYALARRGEAVTLEAVPVRIDEIEVEGYTWPDLSIRVRCGPGTYVRSLARDIGETLGTGGFCAALRRLASGPFRVEDALPLEALSDPAAVRAALRPAWHAVAELSIARLEAAEAMAFAQGREVPAPTVAETTDWIRVHGPAGFVGLGSVVRGGGRIRPRRVLYPEGEDAE